MSKTKIGFVPEPGCDCDPPTVAGSLADGTKGQAYSSSLQLNGTKPIQVEVLFVSEGLSASSDGQQVTVTGTPTSKPSVLFKLSNKCADCETVSFKAKLLDPCIPIVAAIAATIPVSTPNAIAVTGSNIVVTNLASPNGAAFAIEDGYLKFNSDNPGAYKVKLSNACSEVLLQGEFTKAVEPVCTPVSYKGESGNSLFTEGDPANYSILLNGTGPMTIEQGPEDLQNGLVYQIVETAGQFSINITGTPQKLPCDDNAKKECKAYCFVVKNPCGKARVCKTLSYEADNVVPKPVFCAGIVSIVPSTTASPNGYRCFEVTASFFTPNSILYLSTQAENGSPSNSSFAPVENGSSPSATAGELAIQLDGQGAGVKNVCVLSSGSGCYVASLYARHDTCAVLSKFTQITAPLALLNDCFPPDTA